MADRSSAEALAEVPYAVEGCGLEVDACRSSELLLAACLGAQGLGTTLRRERCEHGWVPTLLRHGVPTTTCGVSGLLGSPL